MKALRSIFRLVAAATIVIGGALSVMLFSWIPLHYRDVRFGAWFFSWGVRLLMPALGLRFLCNQPEIIIQHRGLIFPNHISYFDTLVMSYLLPTRFLAKKAVRHWPFIGWIATATGTMYVDRNNQAARSEARSAVAESLRAQPYPPLVVFPEGTTNPTETLLPFRHGVFDIAVRSGIPYLLVAIVYERPDVVTWRSREEGLLSTVRRLARSDPSTVKLVPVQVIHPKPTDEPSRLAAEARQIVGAALASAAASS
jgi:1-acyl-sn-glycerol-3-phosphate acyltransferase